MSYARCTAYLVRHVSLDGIRWAGCCASGGVQEGADTTNERREEGEEVCLRVCWKRVAAEWTLVEAAGWSAGT
jgi:hypothetical protein